MQNIDRIIYLLNHNRSIEDQKLGLSLAMEVECIKAFFQPYGNTFSKEVWENCAKVIASHSDCKLLPYLYDMFMWIQDMNWPGSECIFNRLKNFENSTFVIHLATKFRIVASALGDEVWEKTIIELLEYFEA